MEKLSELSKPVAEIVSKFGDPEAFGEREIKLLTGIQQMAYGTKFYSQEYVSALTQRIAELEQVPTIKHMRSVEESLIHATDMVSELEKRLATPVRLQSPWVDKAGNRWLLEGTTADVIRAAGFAVTVEGDDQ